MNEMVLVPAGDLSPGDVIQGGDMVVRLDELKSTTQHMTLLTPGGTTLHVAYGLTFKLLRRAREEEGRD